MAAIPDCGHSGAAFLLPSQVCNRPEAAYENVGEAFRSQYVGECRKSLSAMKLDTDD